MAHQRQQHLIDDIMQQVLREEHFSQKQTTIPPPPQCLLSCGELACVQELFGSLDATGQGALSKHLLVDAFFSACTATNQAATLLLETDEHGRSTTLQFEQLFSEWKKSHPGPPDSGLLITTAVRAAMTGQATAALQGPHPRSQPQEVCSVGQLGEAADKMGKLGQKQMRTRASLAMWETSEAERYCTELEKMTEQRRVHAETLWCEASKCAARYECHTDAVTACTVRNDTPVPTRSATALTAIGRIHVEDQSLGQIQGAIVQAEAAGDTKRQQRVLLEQKLSEVQISTAAETERLRTVSVELSFQNESRIELEAEFKNACDQISMAQEKIDGLKRALTIKQRELASKHSIYQLLDSQNAPLSHHDMDQLGS